MADVKVVLVSSCAKKKKKNSMQCSTVRPRYYKFVHSEGTGITKINILVPDAGVMFPCSLAHVRARTPIQDTNFRDVFSFCVSSADSLASYLIYLHNERTYFP